MILCLCLLTLAGHGQWARLKMVKLIKQRQQYIHLKRGGVYIGNDPPWLATVLLTTQYLKTHLKKDETFLALVNDPLYYFLTERESPTRLLSFVEHIRIQPEQEKELIRQMEEKGIRWILLSNRAHSEEPGMGVLGHTYCPLLTGYMAQNFEAVATFGHWDKSPGWYHNHGVKILRRTP